jgi:putative ABC transport system permease protein
MRQFRFIIRMVRREIHSSWHHFGFFIFCISLGVGGIVGVGAISNQVEHAMTREGKGLLGGDIEIELNHSLSADGLKVLRELESKGVQETLVLEMMAMAGNGEHSATQLVELKVIQPGYPLYGSLVLDPPAEPTSFSLPGKAWVENSLLVRLGLKSGDQIKLGQATMIIAGIIRKEPDRITEAFSMGPRVMISERSLDETMLVQPGSRVRYRYLLQTPQGMNSAPLIKELKESLKDEKGTIESYQGAQPRLRRFLNNLTAYLGLIGMIALFIGGIGVGNSVDAHLKEKIQTMGILKCLGATSQVIFAIYLTETIIMGLAGSAVGNAFGLILHASFQGYLREMIPQAGAYLFPFVPSIKGVIAALLVVLLFSLIPLYTVLDLSPALIFRRDIPGGKGMLRGTGRWIFFWSVVIGMVLFIFWEAGNFRTGGTFIVIFMLSAVLLKIGGWMILKGVKRIRPSSFILRYGLANLNRPGQFVQSVVFSIGLGTTVITAILFIRAGMIQQINSNIPVDAPSFFFIDIQKDQINLFEQLVAEKYRKWGFSGGHDLNPILRGRLNGVSGIPLAQIKNNQQWFYQREYVLTFQKEPAQENRIVKGAWWTPEEGAEQNLISIEEDVANHLGVGIGSTLTFDLQGVLVGGTITNIRQVNWENLRTNFFIIFSPHQFEGKAVTYIATSRSLPEEDLNFQRDVVRAFPNVTVINVRHILDTFRDIMGKILLAVQFMGGFTIGAGLVVLAGSMAATRYFKLREAVLLKILGASKRKISSIFIVEYMLLGFIAGVIGVIMGWILSLVFLKYTLEIEWKLPIAVFPIVVIATIFLTTTISYFMTRQATQKKPLEILRQN